MNRQHSHDGPAAIPVAPWIDRLPVQLRQDILNEGTPLNLDRNTLLIRQGDHCKHLYLVLSGRLHRYHSDREGSTTFASLVGPGCAVNLTSVILDLCETAVTQAAIRSVCLAVPRSAFVALLQHKPALAIAALEHLAEQCERREMAHVILNVADVRARVATFLCCHTRCGKIALACSLRQAAESLCLRQETLSRALGELLEDGVIQRQGLRSWRVLDEQRLHRRTWCWSEHQEQPSSAQMALCRLKPLAIAVADRSETAEWLYSARSADNAQAEDLPQEPGVF